MQQKGISQNNLEERNHLFSMTYSAALDCKAAQFQGKKKGRRFLIKLQEAVGCNDIPYSQELAESIFEEIGGDLNMLKKIVSLTSLKKYSFLIKKLLGKWASQNTLLQSFTIMPATVILVF